jgi:hypothetical protein
MAITVVTSASNTEATSTTLSIAKPFGTQLGDVLVIIVGNDDTASGDSWTGSTAVTSDGEACPFVFVGEVGSGTSDSHAGAFYRVVDGTEGDEFTVPSDDEDDYWGFCLRLIGVDTSDPLNGVGSDIVDGTPPISITGLTTDVDDCLAFAVFCFDGGDGDPFDVSGTGWSLGEEIGIGTFGGASGGYALRQMSGSGATGTCVVEGNVSDGMAGFQFALNPSVVGGPHEATATTSITVTSAGSAHKRKHETAATSVTVTTAPSGKARRKATAATSITVTSTGAGKSQPQRATATTLITVTGGGAAKKTGKRTATTTVTVTSTGTGKARRKATATTEVSVSSAGTGTAITRVVHTSTAATRVTVSSAGVAHRRKTATGATSLTVVSTGSGKARRKATAVTEITVTVASLAWVPREHVGGPSKLVIPEALVRTRLAIDEKLTRGLLIRVGEED